MKRTLAIAVIAGLIVLGAISAYAVSVGEPAPDFQGVTLAGEEFRLSAYKGQPILLKIGTTWCPSCKTQGKAIDSLQTYLEEKGVRFIDVFIDESKSSVTEYFAKAGYHEPTAIVLDEGAAHRAYNVYVIPRLLLIDKDFRVVRDGDPLPAGKLKKLIDKMLQGD
ncbi:MAG: TlpA disulfide reductase family protein [Desulfuromonadales bacterium]|nr:TlpA disulfide reductase family protein [Desulfuromonadales bacterium]